MPHCPLALISSSASTTSSAPKCRPAPGTWCPTALQPLFLRRGAPRPPPQNADRPRGRGASLPSSPCFFVEEHHVLRLKMPTGPGGVVPTALQPLFLRRGAPRPPLQSAGQPRGRGASLPSSPYFFVEKHHVRLPIFPTGPGAWCLIPRQPLFLRPQAPRQAAQALGRLRMRPDIAKSRLFSINVY